MLQYALYYISTSCGDVISDKAHCIGHNVAYKYDQNIIAMYAGYWKYQKIILAELMSFETSN